MRFLIFLVEGRFSLFTITVINVEVCFLSNYDPNIKSSHKKKIKMRLKTMWSELEI